MEEQPQEPRSIFSKEFWAVLAPGLIVTLIGFLLALSFVGPPPPKTLRFAGGSSWGAYNRFAEVYKEKLAEQGLTIEVIQTKGSFDNMKLLEEGKADIAFVQGGLTAVEGSQTNYVSLGSVFFEPLWVFVKTDQSATLLSELTGKRVAIGSIGSGTRVVALELLEDAEVLQNLTPMDIGGEKAEEMLYKGELDAVFFMGSPTIPAVTRMLKAEGVKLLQFERAEALERRHQFLSKVPLYQGVVDLKKNIPDHDIELLAASATIVVREEFHKALPPVILSAAKDIHGQGTILSEHGDFPSPLYCSFPLATQAQHYYDRGLSFLYRHLPFYFASGLDRMAILLLPFIGLLIPIVRLLPPVYNWTMKRKIYKRYRMLQGLEHKIGLVPYDDLVGELTEIEEAAGKLASMPPAYGADIFALRSNLERVRDRILASSGKIPQLTLQKADKSAHRKPAKPDKDTNIEQQ